MQATTMRAHHDGMSVWILRCAIAHRSSRYARHGMTWREMALSRRLSAQPYLKHTDVSPATNELPGIGRSGVSLGLAFVSRFE